MKIIRKRGMNAVSDLTAMIDIVFQLILFFLVSTTFAVLPGINVNLPQSSTAQAESIGGITITAGENGELFFNEEKVSMQTLDDKLKKFDTEGKNREEYPITLEADEKVTNGTIVKIFDVLRKNGFVAVNLRTTE
ncbi:ExbD/TolR family protein [Treponema pectinovorum]|uniref:ExbD/TolR family protein n=1 Tax=Treponema pectinovorum TaxID=164 RepID=UPI0011C76182|nr:biopolymer transporter ExbD [Treponema pectinovorum]